MRQPFPTQHWDENFSQQDQQVAIDQLESGQILFFPSLTFTLSPEEAMFLNPDFADPHSKNIGYHSRENKLWGVRNLTDQQHLQLKSMLERFANQARRLVQQLLPNYANALTVARTSFRPVQVSGRKSSYRKDDKRLHVDAFPSSPNQGKRILRVFTNINPHGQARIWRVGEPFEQVAKQFLPQIKKPIPGAAAFLRALKITKSYRTAYDHYMLRMHNLMKANEHYQQRAPQQEIHFPAGSTWIVQTDHVSHAAMQGQHVLEQTFYLPVSAMQHPERSPLKVLERLLGQPLV